MTVYTILCQLMCITFCLAIFISIVIIGLNSPTHMKPCVGDLKSNQEIFYVYYCVVSF